MLLYSKYFNNYKLGLTSVVRLYMSGMAQKQIYDYFLVLDFEATCDRNIMIKPQEVIEFPVLKINSINYEVDSIFHEYVCPDVHPNLTSFCTELTGIIQEQIIDQPNLKNTLLLFDDWMKKENLLNENIKSIFVTCGDWDLLTMLPHQCNYLNINYPKYLKHWINIKKSYCDVMGSFPKGMMPMLNSLNLKHTGRHHSGIDDCHNIGKILKSIGMKGYLFKETSNLQSQSNNL